MSLPSRIMFVSAMLAVAALCVWVALSYGGPGTALMWGLTAACVGISIVVWFFKAPEPERLASIRVEGAIEPTYRLMPAEKGAKGEIWQLVLGKTQCALMRPNGERATSFARKWADAAIRLLGFVNGEFLGVVTEDWAPPDSERFLTPDALLKAGKSIRSWADRDTPYYWFVPSKELIQVIQDYKRHTLVELGAEAGDAVLVKARQFMLSGSVGLAAAMGLFIFNFAKASWQGQTPAILGSKPVALGGVIGAIGLWRLGQGVMLYRQTSKSS